MFSYMRKVNLFDYFKELMSCVLTPNDSYYIDGDAYSFTVAIICENPNFFVKFNSIFDSYTATIECLKIKKWNNDEEVNRVFNILSDIFLRIGRLYIDVQYENSDLDYDYYINKLGFGEDEDGDFIVSKDLTYDGPEDSKNPFI